MSRRCSDCRGKGRWLEQIVRADGSTEHTWYECGTCSGSGEEQDPEDGDNFDIGGSSYADED